MKLSDAGAAVAVALASYGVQAGMSPFDALEAAEDVLQAARRTKKGDRMLGEASVLEVMVAMGERITAATATTTGKPADTPGKGPKK